MGGEFESIGEHSLDFNNKLGKKVILEIVKKTPDCKMEECKAMVVDARKYTMAAKNEKLDGGEETKFPEPGYCLLSSMGDFESMSEHDSLRKQAILEMLKKKDEYVMEDYKPMGSDDIKSYSCIQVNLCNFHEKQKAAA